jgi:Ferritin-like
MSLPRRDAVALSRLQWVAPPSIKQRVGVTGLPPRETSALTALLHETGIPRVQDATTAKEEAIGLLQAAAEVEHALLVQYLYALYSLDPSANDRYREILADVAEQEMGHLVTVQGLLMLLGAEPHLDRDLILPGSAFEPIPFLLEPLSVRSLARYVAVEAPALESLSKALAAHVREILEKAQMGEVWEVRRVGALYVMIYWLFQSGDTPQGPSVLCPDGMLPPLHLADTDFVAPQVVKPFLPDATEWSAGSGREIHVLETIDRASALEAIHKISVQGEGFDPSDGPNTHFEMFLEAYDMASITSPLVRPVPAHPNTAGEASADPEIEAGRITDPAARDWARLFNARYRTLLLMIVFSLRLSKDDPIDQELRSKLTSWCFDEMRRGVRGTATILLDMPLRSGAAERAGPPFELVPEPLPKTTDGLVNAITESAAASMTLANSITARGGLSLRQRAQLTALADMDAERRQGLGA